MDWTRVIYCGVAGGGGGSVRERDILDVLAISKYCPLMWRILGALRHVMLKIVKGILDISRHGQVHMFVCIISFQSDAAVESTSSIF
jgi:hypothetical protein